MHMIILSLLKQVLHSRNFVRKVCSVDYIYIMASDGDEDKIMPY